MSLSEGRRSAATSYRDDDVQCCFASIRKEQEGQKRQARWRQQSLVARQLGYQRGEPRQNGLPFGKEGKPQAEISTVYHNMHESHLFVAGNRLPAQAVSKYTNA